MFIPAGTEKLEVAFPEGGSVTFVGAVAKVGVLQVPVAANEEIDLPAGAIVLVLPQGEPAAAETPEPG